MLCTECIHTWKLSPPGSHPTAGNNSVWIFYLQPFWVLSGMWNGSTEGELETGNQGLLHCTVTLCRVSWTKGCCRTWLQIKRCPLWDAKIAKPLKHANGVLAERSSNSPDPKAAGLFWVRVLAAEHLFCFICREKQAKNEQSEEKGRVYVWREVFTCKDSHPEGQRSA